MSQKSCETKEVYFFFLKWSKRYFVQKKKIPLKTIKTTGKFQEFIHNYGDFLSFSGHLGYPPALVKNFLCKFGWFRTCLKKNKKVVKMIKFWDDPPPVVKIHNLFFYFEWTLPLVSHFKNKNYEIFHMLVNRHTARIFEILSYQTE